MSNKYFSGRKDHYIFCDICGQACYDFEVTRLKTETGRGGLLVCRNDIDNIDYGLIPYTVSSEKAVPWSRVIHQNVSISTAPIDYDTTTSLGV